MTAVTPCGRLTISGLSAGYRRRPVLRNLTLPPIEPGGVTGLVGPNGAGKSTLLRVLAGLLPGKGSVQLGDVDLIRMPLGRRAERVSFMPQALPQRVALTVVETVINALKVAPGLNLSTIEAHRRAMAMLERMGIAELALEPLDRLSGGQRQLASLAQALVRSPEVLLLDEPTSSLDLRHQTVVMMLVRDYAAAGRIAIVVLHDLSLAARWASNVVVLKHGIPHASGPPHESITPEVLAEVYGVRSRVETCSQGSLQVIVDGPLAPGAAERTTPGH